MPPKLTVVTIVRQDLPGLRKTVESLRPLAHFSWEHLVVDASPEVHRSYLESLVGWPLHYVPEPPSGIYPALNTGLRLAEGGVLQFLNAGDEIEDASLLVSLVERFYLDPQLDLLVAGANLMRDGTFLYPSLPQIDFLANLIGANRICHQAMLYRRASALRVGPFATRWKIAGDYEHHLKGQLAGWKAQMIPEPLVRYDMAGTSGNYRLALKEFREVQLSLGPAMGPALRWRHTLSFWQNWARISLVKAAAASPFAAWLRPLWLKWQRR